MYIPYPPFMYPQQGQNSDDPLTTWIKVQTFLENEAKKKKDEDDKNKKKKPEPPKFSFLETVGLCFILGPGIGFGYLYVIKILLHHAELLVK